MAELIQHESVSVMGDPLKASRDILEGRMFTENSPIRGEASAVSSRIRNRNIFKAGQILGAAAVVVIITAGVLAFINGIDISSFTPNVIEVASSSGIPFENALQPNLADFGQVQGEPWWVVPQSVRELMRTAINAPMPVKAGAAALAFWSAFWIKMMLGGWSSKGSESSKKEPEI